MTPEEIVNEFATTIVISPPMALRAKAKAIEAIKQYARKMCDKQKEIILSDKSGRILMRTTVMNISKVQIVPYPKELQ